MTCRGGMDGVFGQLYHNDFNILANSGRLVECACVLRGLAGLSCPRGRWHRHPDTILKMPNETYAAFDTTEGKFKVRLFADRVPNTVANFVSLADGSKTGKPIYDATVFHRVIPDFMIQGGDPEGTGRGGPGYKFADEFHPTLQHSKAGFLSMANPGPHTNGRQLFVTVAATPWLDNN